MRLIIGKLSAGRANLYQNDYASGLPSPTACLGFADALSHACGLPRWSASVLPVYHKVEPSVGRVKPEMQRESNSFVTVEIMESKTGYVEFSLIVDLCEEVSIDDVRKFVEKAKFAGSDIFPVRSAFKIKKIGAEGEDLFACNRGYAFTPSGAGTSKNEPVSFGSFDSLKAVADRLISEPREKGRGWIVPAAIGYRHLEKIADFESRKGTRNSDYPHIFVEPGVSIGELISIRSTRLTDVSPDDLKKAFWKWNVTQNGAFVHEIYT